jgi:hypothetical protein
MREVRNAYEVVVWKLKGKRPFGRSKGRWEKNMKMVLK